MHPIDQAELLHGQVVGFGICPRDGGDLAGEGQTLLQGGVQHHDRPGPRLRLRDDPNEQRDVIEREQVRE